MAINHTVLHLMKRAPTLGFLNTGSGVFLPLVSFLDIPEKYVIFIIVSIGFPWIPHGWKKTQSFFFSWCLVWSILCVVKPKHSIHFPWYLNIHALVCDFWPWMVEKLTFLLMMFGLNIAWYAKISEFSTIYVHVQYISLYCLWPLTLESWWGCVSLRVRPSRRGSERQTLTLRFPFCGPL